ncbi:hypothetical protein ACIBUY_01870 [Streptomyces sp. NPDC050085]|uniref:hypothetical protein n=1 Tax=Streptomyces sp. NPDC050085 TaxID=3365600 RepID=UPI0037ABB708
MSGRTHPWAGAWAAALKALLGPQDQAAMARGGNLLGRGALGQLNAEAGRFLATVADKGTGRAHRAEVRIPALDEEQWSAVVPALEPWHAVLRDGAVPHELADPARTAGHRIAPDARDLVLACTCRPRRLPCAHVAALLQHLSARLTATPALLLTVRGLSLSRILRRLAPAQAVSPGPAPPSGSVPGEDVDLLVGDAARRAGLLLGGAAEAPSTDPLTDAVRVLATPAGLPRLGHLAEHTRRPTAQLLQALLAHRYAGPAAAHTVVHPPATLSRKALREAVAEVESARRTAGRIDATVEGRITDEQAGIELRRGPDGRWHPFTRGPSGDWAPAPGAAAGARAAYEAARTAHQQRRRV